MKIAPAQITSFCAKPPAGIRAALFYGPNTALIEQSLAAIKKTLLPKADDFSFVVVTPEMLKTTPTYLADDMSSFGMFADTKLFLLKNAGDSQLRAVQEALAVPDAGHFLLIQADELGPKSVLRLWAEKTDSVAALACYALDGAALQNFVREKITAAGGKIDRDAVAMIIDRLGNDLVGIDPAVQQIMLYKNEPAALITADDIAALFSDRASEALDQFVFAVADRNAKALDGIVQNLRDEGTPLIVLQRSLMTYFHRLRQVNAAQKSGTAIDAAMAQLRPPVFFKNKNKFVQHLRQWPVKSSDAMLRFLIQMESESKISGALPDDVFFARLLFRAQK